MCNSACTRATSQGSNNMPPGQIWPRPTIYTAMSHSSSRRSSLIWNGQWTYKRQLQDHTLHNGPSLKQNEGPTFHMQTRCLIVSRNICCKRFFKLSGVSLYQRIAANLHISVTFIAKFRFKQKPEASCPNFPTALGLLRLELCWFVVLYHFLVLHF